MKKTLAILSMMMCFFVVSLATPAQALTISGPASSSSTVEESNVAWVRENGTLVSEEVREIAKGNNEVVPYRIETYTITQFADGYSLVNAIDEGEVAYESTTYEIWSEEAAAQTNGSGSNSGYDSTYSVLFTLTVNFTDQVHGGVTYRRMTSVSGTYSIEDTQMSVITQSYTLAQLGPTYPNGTSSYEIEEYPLPASSSSWTRIVSSSTFPEIRLTFDGGYQSARYDYSIIRNKTGSHWSGSLSVNVFNI